ncbi:hypothetical protein CDAR_72501 [Caerostris darwini]|uniref:Uncharacterized protein n=1 Tax=Caerostris darwini TaxID=1538125 RepID=A0AAV4MLW0_9ARAC|nr:hypothetical protein CDAR_72501 [Caerostris darwini]
MATTFEVILKVVSLTKKRLDGKLHCVIGWKETEEKRRGRKVDVTRSLIVYLPAKGHTRVSLQHFTTDLQSPGLFHTRALDWKHP